MAIEVRRMWEGGPLRQWSKDNPQRNLTGYAVGLGNELEGYVGSYVCEECGEPCGGVYRRRGAAGGEAKWVCGACRSGRGKNKGGEIPGLTNM
jgi:hypothetical protein